MAFVDDVVDDLWMPSADEQKATEVSSSMEADLQYKQLIVVDEISSAMTKQPSLRHPSHISLLTFGSMRAQSLCLALGDVLDLCFNF